MLQYPNKFDQYKFPLFVTWMKNGQLRGCIGTFGEDLLGQTLQNYSLVAALKDSRFQPVTIQEVPKLRCEISLLSNFEVINDPLDFLPDGTHGIEIEFQGPLNS